MTDYVSATYEVSERHACQGTRLAEYNQVRLHGAINMMTPRVFDKMHRQALKQVT